METELPLLKFEIRFAALFEISVTERHLLTPSTQPMTVPDLVLVDELFLMYLRVSTFGVLPKGFLDGHVQ